MLWTYLITACRVSAILGTRVGDLNYDGVDYRLQVTEKRKNERMSGLPTRTGRTLSRS